MRPTPAELAILSVLWERGPSTVRAVHDVIGPARGVGYTTALKTLQIMLGKGLVTRDDARRPHVFAAAAQRSDVETSLVRELAGRLFRGSSTRLALRALGESQPSRDELDALRALIDEHERTLNEEE